MFVVMLGEVMREVRCIISKIKFVAFISAALPIMDIMRVIMEPWVVVKPCIMLHFLSDALGTQETRSKSRLWLLYSN